MVNLYYNCIYKMVTGIILQSVPESRCLFLQEGSRACKPTFFLTFPAFHCKYKIIALFSCRDIMLDELVIIKCRLCKVPK